MPQVINIYVLGFNQALASSITGVIDLFALAGVTWNRIQQDEPNQVFKVRLASQQAKNIECINGLTLAAHLSFDQLMQKIQTEYDSSNSSNNPTSLSPIPTAIPTPISKNRNILIVPTIGGPIQQVLDQSQSLITLLQKAHKAGWTIAGNCTGNFLLGQAGILDNKMATTHWGFEREFRQRFPKVNLQAQQLITRDENIYCAGGGITWFDLGLHIIERNVNFETAIQTAKAFVIDYRRDNQLSYSLLRLSNAHQDELIKRIQNTIEQQFNQTFNLNQLASQFNLSQRSLIRRFNKAIGMPPITYLQAIRIERAQKMLEETEQSIEHIMNAIGYEDTSSFRRLFKKRTGSTPTEYRNRFSRRL